MKKSVEDVLKACADKEELEKRVDNMKRGIDSQIGMLKTLRGVDLSAIKSKPDLDGSIRFFEGLKNDLSIVKGGRAAASGWTGSSTMASPIRVVLQESESDEDLFEDTDEDGKSPPSKDGGFPAREGPGFTRPSR